MTTTTLDADWLLVLRQVHALRAQGRTSQQALEVVAQSLPAGPLKTDVADVVAALVRGQAPSPPPPSSLGNPAKDVLARGDAAASDVVDAVIRSLDARVRAAATSRN